MTGQTVFPPVAFRENGPLPGEIHDGDQSPIVILDGVLEESDPVPPGRGLPTDLDFFIGPVSAKTSVPPGQRAVAPAVLRDIRPLTVAMTCLICTRDRLQSAQIVYDARAEVSSHALFRIMPASGEANAITFTVSSAGVEYDHIVVPVQVLKEGELATSGVELRISTVSNPPVEGPTADLRLWIGQDGGGSLTVEVQAYRADLRARLNPYLHGKAARKFKGGLSHWSLDDINRSIYMAIRGIVNQKEESLQKVLRQTGMAIRAPTTEVSLSAAEGDDLAARLLIVGQQFYDGLFISGADADLSKIMEVIEDAASRQPLRVRLETSDVEAPWQFLHPITTAERDAFWGFRYILAVRPTNLLQGGRLADSVLSGPTLGLLFATYNGDESVDVVAALGAAQLRDLQSLRAHPDVGVVRSKRDLLTALRFGAGSLAVVVVFTHGTSGAALIQGGAGPLAVTDFVGQRLMFGPDDKLTPAELRALAYRTPAGGPVQLGLAPLVIFNACESGTYGFAPASNSGFPAAALRLGPES